MAKSRNRSRDARKRAAKKRKNRDYQARKLDSIAAMAKMREIAALTNPSQEKEDGTR